MGKYTQIGAAGGSAFGPVGTAIGTAVGFIADAFGPSERSIDDSHVMLDQLTQQSGRVTGISKDDILAAGKSAGWAGDVIASINTGYDAVTGEFTHDPHHEGHGFVGYFYSANPIKGFLTKGHDEKYPLDSNYTPPDLLASLQPQRQTTSSRTSAPMQNSLLKNGIVTQQQAAQSSDPISEIVNAILSIFGL